MIYPKLGLMTKRSTLTFPKSIAASSFLDLQDFRKREAGRINSLQERLIIPNFSYLNCCTVARFIYSIYHLAKKPNIFCANNLWNVQEVIRKSMLESKR